MREGATLGFSSGVMLLGVVDVGVSLIREQDGWDLQGGKVAMGIKQMPPGRWNRHEWVLLVQVGRAMDVDRKGKCGCRLV